jgi:hypothetical protein
MPIPAKLRAPGWYRAAMFEVLGLGFAFGITVLIRTLMHEHPVIDGDAITIVALIAVPPARPPAPRTIPPTALTAGATTSGSTPTTR